MAKKTKAIKIPLSKLDKFIYVILIALCFVLEIFILFNYEEYIINKNFSDPSTVAITIYFDQLSYIVPFILTFTLSFTLLFGYGITKKQPIFGNKRYKPKWDQPVIKTFPIFSKEFIENLSDKRKKEAKKIVKIVAIILVLSILTVPFGIYSRNILDCNNNFLTYNSFNHVTHSYNIEDAQKLIIDVYRGRRQWNRCGIFFKFIFEDKSYAIEFNTFTPNMDSMETLEHMLYLKSFFEPDRYEIRNADMIHDLIDYQKFDSLESSLVYKLFDY